ncbi:MAG: hemerythrin domain-containing protein [Myxococcota bacterium]
MNAIDFLISEHNKVRKTMADISDDSHREETKHKLFEELKADLLRHEEMEQTVWYPHFRNHKDLKDTVKHLLVEENGAEKALKSFDKKMDQDEWEMKFKKLKQDVEHHAKEEEKELFPEVKRILDEDTLEKIGKEMREFKQQYNP